MINMRWGDSLWYDVTKKEETVCSLISVTIREKEDVHFINIIIWRLSVAIWLYRLEDLLLRRLVKNAKSDQQDKTDDTTRLY